MRNNSTWSQFWRITRKVCWVWELRARKRRSKQKSRYPWSSLRSRTKCSQICPLLWGNSLSGNSRSKIPTRRRCWKRRLWAMKATHLNLKSSKTWMSTNGQWSIWRRDTLYQLQKRFKKCSHQSLSSTKPNGSMTWARWAAGGTSS